jgi:hypothetical protein
MKRAAKKPEVTITHMLGSTVLCDFGSCVEPAYVRVQFRQGHGWFHRCLACATRHDDEGRLHRAIRLCG